MRNINRSPPSSAAIELSATDSELDGQLIKVLVRTSASGYSRHSQSLLVHHRRTAIDKSIRSHPGCRTYVTLIWRRPFVKGMIGSTILPQRCAHGKLVIRKSRTYEVCLWHMAMQFFEADMPVIEIPGGLHHRR